MTSWFEELMSRDKRRAVRYLAPRLVAYYWDGGAPRPHLIRDISFSGLYLLTEQRWYPGTVITMTLQRTEPGDTGAKESIPVQAKAIRQGDDGMGFAFMLPQAQDVRRVHDIISEGVEMADRTSLHRFLRQLLGNTGLIDKHC